MEVAGFSEKLENIYKPTFRHIPEDSELHSSGVDTVSYNAGPYISITVHNFYQFGSLRTG
jgi:hypothetical protein